MDTHRKGWLPWWARIAVTALAVAGAAAGISPAMAAGRGNTPGPAISATCTHQLWVIRAVSRRAGLTIGSQHTSPRSQGTPAQWAMALREAGLAGLARTALAIRDRQSDHDFAVAMTETASAMLTGHCQQAKHAPLPGWVHWRRAPSTLNGTPCFYIWGGPHYSSAYVCADGELYVH